MEALANAITAPMAGNTSSAPELTGCTLPQLARLHEVIEGCWRHVGTHTQAPCYWDDRQENYNAAGRLLDAEADRLDALLSAINVEAARRIPVDDDARNERLSLLLRHDILCNGKIVDRALLTEAVEA